MIPLIMRMRIREREKREIRLWLPLFLIWILLLPFILIALVVWMISALLGVLFKGCGRVALILQSVVSVLWYLGDLRIDVKQANGNIVRVLF